MVRFIVLAAAVLVLAAVPLGGAEARAHRPPAASHGKKKPEARKSESRGRTTVHGRHAAEDDGEDVTRARHGARGREAAEEHCTTSRGRHGRRTVCTPVRAGRDDSYDEAPRHGGAGRGHVAETRTGDGCTPARARTHGRHGRKPAAACQPRAYARLDAPPARPAPKSIDEALEAAVDAPAAPVPSGAAHGTSVPGGYTPGPPVLTPPPPPPLAPDSPAAKIKHANPAPGVIVVTNPDLWAERRQAEHRNRATAARLTLASMMGRSDADLRSALGVPDLQRTEGDGALWTYRMPTCSLMVFLHRASGVAFKVTGAQTGPLMRGDPAPDVDQCLRTAGSR